MKLEQTNLCGIYIKRKRKERQPREPSGPRIDRNMKALAEGREIRLCGCSLCMRGSLSESCVFMLYTPDYFNGGHDEFGRIKLSVIRKLIVHGLVGRKKPFLDEI